LSIQADLAEGYLIGPTLDKLRQEFPDLSLPADVRVEFKGGAEQQAESTSFMFRGFALALAMMAMILLTQFNSIFQSVLILTAVIFSTGGVLSLIMAAERPDNLAAVAAISAPLKFKNRNLIFVPLLQGANNLTQWLPSFEGVMPFQSNDSEHPHINYRNMAIRGLFELRRAVDEMERRLGDVACPVMLFQGDEDSVVDPASASLIFEKLGAGRKWLRMIASKRHGILNENIGDVQEKVLEFLSAVAEGRDPA